MDNKNTVPNKPDYLGDRPEAPEKPASPKYNLSVVEQIFNEWNKRYSKNPGDFSDPLDKDGKPIDDYGESCAFYFQKISDELFNKD